MWWWWIWENFSIRKQVKFHTDDDDNDDNSWALNVHWYQSMLLCNFNRFHSSLTVSLSCVIVMPQIANYISHSWLPRYDWHESYLEKFDSSWSFSPPSYMSIHSSLLIAWYSFSHRLDFDFGIFNNFFTCTFSLSVSCTFSLEHIFLLIHRLIRLSHVKQSNAIICDRDR